MAVATRDDGALAADLLGTRGLLTNCICRLGGTRAQQTPEVTIARCTLFCTNMLIILTCSEHANHSHVQRAPARHSPRLQPVSAQRALSRLLVALDLLPTLTDSVLA